MDRARTSVHAPTAFWLALAGVYTAIAVFLTWPQAAEMSSVPVHQDTLFSVWRIAWVAHQLVRDPLHLFGHFLAYGQTVPSFSPALRNRH